MKIAQVNTFFRPVIGGIEQYILDLSLELARRGHEVHIFTANKRRGKSLGPSKEIFNGIYIHRIPVFIDVSYRVKLWPKLLSELFHGNFDLIHTYCQGNFHTIASFMVRKLRQIPLVVTTYGPLHKQANYPLHKKIPLKMYDSLLTSSIFNVADKVLARNPLIVPWLKTLGINEEKIEVTPSGLPEECFTLRSGEIFNNKYNLHDWEIVLYIGRINPQKGIQYLVKAAPIVLEKIPNAIFVFIGPDEIDYARKLIELGEKLRVKERIFILGSIYQIEEEMEAYAASHVFVMPSSFEGFGQAVLKAMAQGKPVIATKVGALPYLVSDGLEGLLIDYGDERKLADAIVKILLTPDFACRLGYHARERAKNFLYEATVDKIESIYFETYRRVVKD